MVIIAGRDRPAAAFGDWPQRLAATTRSPAEFVEDIVGAMTLAEKIAAMHGDPEFWAGMIDMVGGPYNEHPFIAASNARLGTPGVRFTDGPRGIALGHSTAFPVSMARGATWNPDLEQRVGAAMGLEARAQGANVVGAVCVNLLRHPGWGRAQETYGEDVHHVAAMGVALTRGIQEHTMACVKHFAANSIENARFSIDVTVPTRPLHEVYLEQFRRIVDAGVASVMSAYNMVNGEWCGQSRPLLTEILRDRWGFTGFVMTDWVWGLRDAERGALGGQDLEMPSGNFYARFLPDLVASGAVPESAVTASVTRTLTTLAAFAASTRADPGGAPARSVVAGSAHRTLAREVARQSIVLLRNEGDLLPLDPAALGTVATIGRFAAVPNLGDHGSSRVRAEGVVTPFDGLVAALGAERVALDDGTDPGRAATVAAAADVAVLVVGYDHTEEGEYLGMGDHPELFALFPPMEDPELGARFGAALAGGEEDGVAQGGGGDRRSLRLRPEDEALIAAVTAAQPRTLVVIMAGSAVVMPWRHSVPGILMLFYPGVEGGGALADILFGRANPSGRLPFVIPESEDGLPEFDPDAGSVTYGLLHGQAWLDAQGIEPAYPLGFGLGYSTFTVTDAAFSPDRRLRAVVRNTGGRAGATVVFAEVSVPRSAVERMPRRIVGFTRVELPAGGRTEVVLPVSDNDLVYFDESVDDFVLEDTDYHFRITPHLGGPADHELVWTPHAT